MLQQCNVVNSCMLANGGAWNYAPVEIHGLRVTEFMRCGDITELSIQQRSQVECIVNLS